MILANTPSRYGAIAMTLHWLIATALLINIALGLIMSEILADSDPLHAPILQLHKSIGLSVLTLSVLRLVWRLINPAPPLPQSMSRNVRLLAHVSHFLLYVLIIAIPLSGWALASASRAGMSTNFFGFFHWPNLAFIGNLPASAKHSLHGSFDLTHVTLAISALVLVPLHIAGAFYHRGGADDVMARMVPWARTSGR